MAEITDKMREYWEKIKTKKEYNALLTSGLFYEIFPGLSGNYEDDKKLFERSKFKEARGIFLNKYYDESTLNYVYSVKEVDNKINLYEKAVKELEEKYHKEKNELLLNYKNSVSFKFFDEIVKMFHDNEELMDKLNIKALDSIADGIIKYFKNLKLLKGELEFSQVSWLIEMAEGSFLHKKIDNFHQYQAASILHQLGVEVINLIPI